MTDTTWRLTTTAIECTILICAFKLNGLIWAAALFVAMAAMNACRLQWACKP